MSRQHLFPIDRRAGIEYTMDEAILCSCPGELDPGVGTQILSLCFIYVVHAGLSGVFFFHSLYKQLATAFCRPCTLTT